MVFHKILFFFKMNSETFWIHVVIQVCVESFLRKDKSKKSCLECTVQRGMAGLVAILDYRRKNQFLWNACKLRISALKPLKKGLKQMILYILYFFILLKLTIHWICDIKTLPIILNQKPNLHKTNQNRYRPTLFVLNQPDCQEIKNTLILTISIPLIFSNKKTVCICIVSSKTLVYVS